jgi:CDP-6-deoxy-D-xylo-4-hexulose-3-dehydrase
MGAAFGNAQLDKLPTFRKTRESNFKELQRFFKKYEDFFILPIQEKEVRTQWLAFPLTIKASAPFSRLDIATYLEKHNVQTRPVFTGNILKQPGFKNIKCRLASKEFPVTDDIMEKGFVVGCHHGMERKHIKGLENLFDSFLAKF